MLSIRCAAQNTALLHELSACAGIGRCVSALAWANPVHRDTFIFGPRPAACTGSEVLSSQDNR